MEAMDEITVRISAAAGSGLLVAALI